MLRAGDRIPEVELPDQHGAIVRLRDLLQVGPVVLFFCPAAMPRGRAEESRHFRDLAKEFAELGAQPVGISTEPVDRQKRLADSEDLGYPLLSDADGQVVRAFGVRRMRPLPARRVTFVIGADGTVLDVISSEFRMARHADGALAALRKF